jgi:hypothetical protein
LGRKAAANFAPENKRSGEQAGEDDLLELIEAVVWQQAK